MTEKQIEARMVKSIKERGGLCYKFTSPRQLRCAGQNSNNDGGPYHLCRVENGERRT